MNALDTLKDFVAKQQAFNTQTATAIDSINEGVGGIKVTTVNIQADVGTLNDTIKKLSDQIASEGDVSPEVQALVDAATAQSQAVADKATAAVTQVAETKAQVEAVDALTPPVAAPVS